MRYRISTNAAVFCIATLFGTSSASAQQCQDGRCQLYGNSATDTGQVQVPRYRSRNDLRYTGTHNRDSQTHSGAACADGKCGLNTACRACDCDTDGRNCDCGPNCPPHDYPAALSQSQIPAPPRFPEQRPIPQSRRANDDRDINQPFGRPSSGTYQPARFTNAVNWKTDIRTAAEESRATGQPMLVQVTATWCGYCRRMKEETYTNRALISGVNRDFITVNVDADQNRELVQKMQIKSLPTTLIVMPNLQVVERLEGFQSASQLQSVLDRFLQRAALDRSGSIAGR